MALLFADASWWEDFVAGRRRIEPEAGQLWPRWDRVLALGVDPTRWDEKVVTESEIRERREPLERLWRSDVLEPVARAFAARDFVLVLSDPDGVVVHTTAGGRFHDEARRQRLIDGASWGERDRGTNAIGTAIAEDIAISVVGPAHWSRANHRLVCHAAPIHDAFGRIIGILDATSRVETDDPFAAPMVVAAARALSEWLRAQTLSGEILARRQLERHPGPGWLVDASGVRGANAAGRPLGGFPVPFPDLVRTLGQHAVVPHGPLQGQRYRVEVSGDAEGEVLSVLVLVDGAARAPAPRPFARFLGSDPALLAALDGAGRLAATRLPILILAETGTGKELLARAIHDASPQSKGPFVAVNCGSLSPGLLEAELFGHAPGAFTGALRQGRDGLVASADKGTLFLDEIAEMPGPLQAMLLRFLEDGTYRRVGDPTPRRAQVRLVAATCRDLSALVASGGFRSDLYYRVRGGVCTLPPLRDRHDLQELVLGLLGRLAGEQGLVTPRITDEAMGRLLAWRWPGNVRELRMVLAHALALCDADVIEITDLRLDGPDVREKAPALDDAEADAVRRALRAAGGNLSRAARALGVARSTLYRMIERHRL